MPTNSTEMYEKARQHWEDGELDEAEIVYRQLIAFDPKFTYAFYDLGVLLKESKPEAKDEIRTYLERFIKLAKPHTELIEQVRNAREVIDTLSDKPTIQTVLTNLTGHWKTSEAIFNTGGSKSIIIQVKQSGKKVVGKLAQRIFVIPYYNKTMYYYLHKGHTIFEGTIDGNEGKIQLSGKNGEEMGTSAQLRIENEDLFVINYGRFSFYRQDHSADFDEVNPKAAELDEKKAGELGKQLFVELANMYTNIYWRKHNLNLDKTSLIDRKIGLFERNRLKNQIKEAEKFIFKAEAEYNKKMIECKKALKNYPEIFNFYITVNNFPDSERLKE